MTSPGAGTSARAADSRGLQVTARVGYAVTGLLHLLIGWIAVQAALGSSEGSSADQSGALSQIARQPFGEVLLWIGVVGFTGLGLLYLSQAVPSAAATGERLKSAAKAVVYLVLAWTTLGFARGAGSDSGEQSADLTASVMGMPGGRFLVAGVGVAVVAVGGYHVHKGWSRAFLQDLRGGAAGTLGRAVVRLGTGGYVAKGVALVVVGVLFVVAAVQADPSEATGLDGALGALREQPLGTVLLVLVGLGLAAYGLYSFARARYGQLPG